VILTGNCLEVLKDVPDNSIDAVVTDPPYGLSFMGKKWDYDVPSVEIWREVLRVLKPGGHVLSFGGTRTYHRMVVNIEDAGFEIRDQIQWIYGSGFPKSLNIGKAIDKAAGVELEIVGNGRSGSNSRAYQAEEKTTAGTYHQTKSNKEWQGWGTALKPANEPICLARKPLDGTVAANVEKWGVGGINVDGTRIGTEQVTDYFQEQSEKGRAGRGQHKSTAMNELRGSNLVNGFSTGRWPANVIFDEEAAAMLDEQSGVLKSGALKPYTTVNTSKTSIAYDGTKTWTGDASYGGASRFFYVAKASKRERNAGLEGMPFKTNDTHNNPSRMVGASAAKAKAKMDTSGTAGNQNHHPTVKPIKLMEYLVKMITPPNGIVLDPFAGSGSTGVAAVGLGFDFIGIEMSEEYAAIATKRIEAAQNKTNQD